MKKWISSRQAGCSLLVVFALFILFHLSIVLKILPYDMVWGGRLESAEQAVVMESVGIAVMLLFSWIIVVRAEILNYGRSNRFFKISAWVVFAYLLFTILGNATSQSGLERTLFTPLSVVMTLLAWRVAAD